MGGRGVKESNFDNVKLENRLKICPECGNQVPTIAKYCPFCGKPLNDNSVEKNPTKKYIQIVAGALAIIVFAYIFWRVDIFSIIQKDRECLSCKVTEPLESDIQFLIRIQLCPQKQRRLGM